MSELKNIKFVGFALVSDFIKDCELEKIELICNLSFCNNKVEPKINKSLCPHHENEMVDSMKEIEND